MHCLSCSATFEEVLDAMLLDKNTPINYGGRRQLRPVAGGGGGLVFFVSPTTNCKLPVPEWKVILPDPFRARQPQMFPV